MTIVQSSTRPSTDVNHYIVLLNFFKYINCFCLIFNIFSLNPINITSFYIILFFWLVVCAICDKAELHSFRKIYENAYSLMNVNGCLPFSVLLQLKYPSPFSTDCETTRRKFVIKKHYGDSVENISTLEEHSQGAFGASPGNSFAALTKKIFINKQFKIPFLFFCTVPLHILIKFGLVILYNCNNQNIQSRNNCLGNMIFHIHWEEMRQFCFSFIYK